MITYQGEGEPVSLHVPTCHGTTDKRLAWPTRTPGVYVLKRDCPGTPGRWVHCYAVYPAALGAVLPLCFPAPLCAATFSSHLRDLLLAAHLRDLFDSGHGADRVRSILGQPDDLLAIARCYGGTQHITGCGCQNTSAPVQGAEVFE